MNDKQRKYPELARELEKLLEDDQNEWREYARKEHYADSNSEPKTEKMLLRQHVQARAKRMLEILDEVSEPSINNIGADGALAMSVLATHTSIETTRHVLKAFIKMYAHNESDTRQESIPAMTDWIAVLEHRNQKFGTIWLTDIDGHPFLPTVDNFDNVDAIRGEYGIEPLHWPKSSAISIEEQPWLTKPLCELVMREPTDEEYEIFVNDYLD